MTYRLKVPRIALSYDFDENNRKIHVLLQIRFLLTKKQRKKFRTKFAIQTIVHRMRKVAKREFISEKRFRSENLKNSEK